MNILVVDDDIDAAESLMEFIESAGHFVTMCFGGEEAVAEFTRHEFQLVFMDLKMPRISGKEAIVRILEMDPNAKVAVLSGNTVQEDVDEVRNLGVLEIFRKPCKPEMLLKLIENENISHSATHR